MLTYVKVKCFPRVHNWITSDKMWQDNQTGQLTVAVHVYLLWDIRLYPKRDFQNIHPITARALHRNTSSMCLKLSGLSGINLATDYNKAGALDCLICTKNWKESSGSIYKIRFPSFVRGVRFSCWGLLGFNESPRTQFPSLVRDFMVIFQHRWLWIFIRQRTIAKNS